MELAVPTITQSSPGGLTMHVNKVHSVKTIDRVARELGENVDWLHDVVDEMDTEDGVIWVYGETDDGVMAFTDFGIETLTDLIEMHKQDPTILQRRNNQEWASCGSRRMVTMQSQKSRLRHYRSSRNCGHDRGTQSGDATAIGAIPGAAGRSRTDGHTGRPARAGSPP